MLPSYTKYKKKELYRSSYSNDSYSDKGETMDQKTMMIKCFRCGKQHLLLEMVMDVSSKGMVCRPCAGLPPVGSPRAAPSTPKPSTIREQFARPKNPRSSAGKYSCTNCKYRFSSNKPLDQISCPYCGSKRISTPEESSADAILRDAGRRDYDF
jgi:DNA-directed RNA polymerase subunit RPC12/RpoP